MNKYKLYFYILPIVIAMSIGPIYAQNPFLNAKNKVLTEQSEPVKTTSTENQVRKIIDYPQWFQKVLLQITLLQKKIREHLSQFGKNIKENPTGNSFWMFLLFSFIYGIIHALGPGHGKTIVCSYFLNRPGKYLHGIMMGNFCSFIHSFSSVAIIIGIYIILKTTSLVQFETVSDLLTRISYLFLVLIGIFLFGMTLYNLFHRDKIFQAHSHETKTVDTRLMLLTAFASGIVPCPGAALILIFSITQNIFTHGLIAIVCIALGMGLTTSFFAILTIMSRNTLFHLTEKNKSLFLFIYLTFSFIGATIVMFTGLLFFSCQL
ncbi:high-affinity nickel-transporter [Candidatus Magnetomorum sp. HK-1]|nr:high-affinity nickel-transporter [Candidatus Magnetomorum sp. HK-1]